MRSTAQEQANIPSCPDLTNSLKKSQFYPSAGLYTINHSNISQRQTVMTSEPQFISGIQKYAVSNKTLSFDSNNKCCISRRWDSGNHHTTQKKDSHN